jgi:predicted transcriptional regulator of viral defense system
LLKCDEDIKLFIVNQSDHILELARHRRVLRAVDVRALGWSPQMLIRLHQQGKLQRIARGMYGLPDADVTEHQTLIEVCQRVPKGVLCLLSALQFHEIGTQLPHDVWVALPEGSQTPVLSYPKLRIARLRGAAYSDGP